MRALFFVSYNVSSAGIELSHYSYQVIKQPKSLTKAETMTSFWFGLVHVVLPLACNTVYGCLA